MRVIVVLTVLAATLLLTAGTIKVLVDRAQASYAANIQRFGDPFSALPVSARPTVDPAAQGALNILLLGSDSRVSAGDPSQWTVGGQRTDAIILVHVQADRQGAYFVSIPRDSWVPIPGHAPGKINAAYSLGGPTLMVRTVEQLTRVKVGHLAIVDFQGFQEITDALGGVTVTIPKGTSDERASFPPGTYTMDGATALNYVRQRHNLPGGDFDREKRQQNWLRAAVSKMAAGGTLANPLELNRVLSALTKSLATDDGFTLEQMTTIATSMRDAKPGHVKFFSAPVKSTGLSPDGSRQAVVNLDASGGRHLWEAARVDRVQEYIQRYRPGLLGSTVR
jgi:LCP family protein required for cell wall assembly